jgi:hypothetical protein
MIIISSTVRRPSVRMYTYNAYVILKHLHVPRACLQEYQSVHVLHYRDLYPIHI